jgi:hypothetical protein
LNVGTSTSKVSSLPKVIDSSVSLVLMMMVLLQCAACFVICRSDFGSRNL